MLTLFVFCFVICTCSSGTKDGMELQALDSSRVALVHLRLYCSCFEKYRCERNLVLNLSIHQLVKVLQCAKIGDNVSLKAEVNSDQVTINFRDKTGVYSVYYVNRRNIPNEDLTTIPVSHVMIIFIRTNRFTCIYVCVLVCIESKGN